MIIDNNLVRVYTKSRYAEGVKNSKKESAAEENQKSHFEKFYSAGKIAAASRSGKTDKRPTCIDLHYTLGEKYCTVEWW